MKKEAISRLLSLIILMVAGHMLFSQQAARIRLVGARDLRYDKRLGENIQRLIGDVILKHDSTWLYCDSAWLDEPNNNFDGFGHVRIKVSDTLNIYGDLLHYEGNTRIAELTGNVKLEDPQAILTTDHLWYDRNRGTAWYLTGGRIKDRENDLTSMKGQYLTHLKEARFSDSVVLTNPRYVMNSDTLHYHTETELSRFFGPTVITSDDNLIYCERGWYDTGNEKSRFWKNPFLVTGDQRLSGDTIYYDRMMDWGQATGNVFLTDTVQDVFIEGGYGEFSKRDGMAFVVDSAMAVLIEKKDSLFLHADTLLMHFDSLQQLKRMYGYYKAKFFRRDLQGMTDSLVYSYRDSTIMMYHRPVLWSEDNQMTADSAYIAMKNNQVDTMALMNNAFIASVDDPAAGSFNQIRGKIFTGYFRDNQIVRIKVLGNSETIYWVREDNGSLIGINKTASTDMLIHLKDNDIQTITYIRDPKGAVYPENELTAEDLFLKDFKWHIERRPLKKADIFVW
ncbi:MAG: hypothetical protein JW861_02325 [Bacteroidales bacterium]|nr:hypothetical protein [Bacteroidales bacterium]